MKRLILGKGKTSHIISKEQDVVLSKSECDVTIFKDVRKVITEHAPDIVINCAAKTNLEYCEQNKLDSFNANTQGVLNVLDVCADRSIKLVHISSGCLFDGNEKISTEESSTTPRVWYTKTKNWSDEIIQSFGYQDYLILRPRQIISSVPNPTNMLTKFLKMKSIEAIEEENSVTCLEDFSLMIDHLVENNLRGIFNCANTDTITPFYIAKRISETLSKDLKVSKIEYKNLLEKMPNKRVNTILSTKKLEETGFKPRPAKDALEWCLKNYGN